FCRGRPRRSIVRAATISACVESSPPDTPIASFFSPVADRRWAKPWTWMVGRAGGGAARNLHAADRRQPLGNQPCIVAKSIGAHALLADAAEIDIGDGDFRLRAEPLGLDERIADLENSGLSVPGQIGRRLACPGRRIGIGGDAARRLRGAQ